MGVQMMNKKGLEFKATFFAIVAVGIIITAVGIIVSGWNSYYQSGLTYDLGEYNQMSSLQSYTANYTSTITPNTPDQGSDFEATTYRGVYGIIVNIFQPFRIVFGEGGMLDSITTRFGIPDFVKQGIIIMMLAAIVFTLVAIIFRQLRGTV